MASQMASRARICTSSELGMSAQSRTRACTSAPQSVVSSRVSCRAYGPSMVGCMLLGACRGMHAVSAAWRFCEHSATAGLEL